MDWSRSRALRADYVEFVERNWTRVTQAAYLITWHLPAAEDAAQEAFLTAAKQWPRVNSMENPYGFVRRIAVNAALDDLRVGKVRTSSRGEPEYVGTDQQLARYLSDHQIDTVVARTDLRAAMQKLPSRQRAVLALRFFEDMTEQQVADVLDCPLGTVKSNTARALTQLRANLNVSSMNVSSKRVGQG